MHGFRTGFSSGSGDVSGLLQEAHFGGSSGSRAEVAGWGGADSCDEVDVCWVPEGPASTESVAALLPPGASLLSAIVILVDAPDMRVNFDRCDGEVCDREHWRRRERSQLLSLQSVSPNGWSVTDV